MKYIQIILPLILISCQSLRETERLESKAGVYETKETSLKIELLADSTYTIHNSGYFGHMPVEECAYLSKGKWKQIDKNVALLLSENKYMAEDGYKYELKEERKLSDDSVYIEIKFPTDFHPVTLYFTFEPYRSSSKTFTTRDTFIRLPKVKEHWEYQYSGPTIQFEIRPTLDGELNYVARTYFEIFTLDIKSSKTNYITINLPFFDRCFITFMPIEQFIYFSKPNEFQWYGETWKKK